MADGTAQPTAVDIDQLAINTIRTLSIDAIQKANSGHPGTPMALAPVAYTLWQKFLRFDPQDPIWPNRDRFVLSAGHASMLLYALLHLARVKAVDPDYEIVGDPAVSLEDIKRFRQLDSRAAGHPEYRWTSGVETTTGPLGQGIATSVGMAIASKWQAATYDRPGFGLFDFDTYAIAGDGCLMEGVSNEAGSIAGHLKLDNLCWIYDNNHITIDGRTEITYDDNVGERFSAYGWNVSEVTDANDLGALEKAFEGFKAEGERPTLIIVDSHIGWGAPHKVDTPEAHGEPLGEEEVRETKRAYGWPEDAEFLVPEGVYECFADGVGKRGAELREEWQALIDGYHREHETLAHELEAMQRRELPEEWDAEIPSFEPDEKGLATRKASNKVENAVAKGIPWLLSGSADLTDSTSVRLEDTDNFEPETRAGRQLHFGVREHESAAISNGLSLSKLRPLWSTYLVFSDYARPAIRLSALMELPVIHLFTHDSIGLGEDGPTHQPVEHLASLRAVPGLDVIRPCDANETAEAWRAALDRHHGPVALVLTRQDVPILDRSVYAPADGLRRGGYVLADSEGDPELILIATGSEVSLAVQAHEKLAADGVSSRVVSLPCWELFDRQDDAYKDEVLPPGVTARVSIEEAATLGWDRWVGPEGATIGMHTFGSSAPLKDVQDKFGFTPDKIVETAKGLLPMNPTKELHDLGQSLWVDNITRSMLDDGTLASYINEHSVTGLTSNPTIFDKAISQGHDYDEQVAELDAKGLSPEDAFFEIAISDLRRAADLFAPEHERTDGVDGRVSLEVSPVFAYDSAKTTEQAAKLWEQAERPNFFIKIPGTPEGLKPIEDSIFAGIPINVTLLFSTEHYLAAADAYMKGIERRIEAGLNPHVESVASLFISRWDGAIADTAPDELKNKLGIAVGKRAYKAYRELLASERFMKLENEGAHPQRLLWASTGTKDPEASDTLYVEALASPLTVNTMPDKTLLAFADHGEVGEPLPADGGDAEQQLQAFRDAGIDPDELAAKLQTDGAASFVKSWEGLVESISSQAQAA